MYDQVAVPSSPKNLTIHNLHPEPVAAHVMARMEEDGASWDEFDGAWHDDEADEACHLFASKTPMTDGMKARADAAFFETRENTLDALNF